MAMGFLDRLRTPGYSYQPVGRLNRPPLEEEDNRPPMMVEPIANRGMINQIGSRGMFGPLQQSNNPGGQNITGFGQTDQNVVYDQRPEQFEKELKLRKRELDIREKQADALTGLKTYDADTRRLNAQTAMGRNDIAMFKAQNPNMILKASAGGNYFAIDPQTGEVMDTGIPVGNMTQEGAINLRQTGSEKIQGMRGDTAREVANIGATSRREMNDADNIAAMERVMATLTGQPNTPTINETVVRAQQYINEHPGSEKYIKITKDGKGVVINRPKSQVGSGQVSTPNQNKSIGQTLAEKLGFGGNDTNMEGPEMQEWQDINRAIYEPRRDLSKNPFMQGPVTTPFAGNNEPSIGIRPNPAGDSGGEFVVMEFPDKTRRKVKKSDVEKYSKWGKVVG